MAKNRLLSGATAFGHLMGLPPKPKGHKPHGARAEDPKDPKDPDGRKAEDVDPEKPLDDDAEQNGADHMVDCEECDGTGEVDGEVCDECDGLGEVPKADEDGGDGDDVDAEDREKEKTAARKAGRMAERARCKAIFASPAAGARPDVAAQLAFTTGMSAPRAIGLLQSAAAGGSSRAANLHDRMNRTPRVPNVGPDGGGTAEGGDFAQQMKAAVNKARPGR